MPLTYLRASQRDGPRACFSLTMPLAIKSMQMMHSQLGGWSKVCVLCFSQLLTSQLFQPQGRAGHTTKMVHTCMTAAFLWVNRNCFISLMITPPCLDGLRVWRSLFMNGGCGQNRGWLLSAPTFIAQLVAPTAAPDGSFSHNPISLLKNCSYRNSSRGTAICATSTQSIIAS